MVGRWLTAFDETIDATNLTNPLAREVAAFLQRYAADIDTLVECRRDAERELIVLDLVTGAPQAPVYPIRNHERIGILFIGEGRLPFVAMLSDDFRIRSTSRLSPRIIRWSSASTTGRGRRRGLPPT